MRDLRKNGRNMNSYAFNGLLMRLRKPERVGLWDSERSLIVIGEGRKNPTGYINKEEMWVATVTFRY